MAGYAGYSKSKNALQAESENKFPLTIAVKAIAAAIVGDDYILHVAHA